VIDSHITSALSILVAYVPEGQKIQAVTQWAQGIFSDPQNLGIRQATINQIASKEDEFGKDVVETLRAEYNRISSSGSPTPIRQDKTRQDKTDKVILMKQM
jgi:hypothetical protein